MRGDHPVAGGQRANWIETVCCGHGPLPGGLISLCSETILTHPLSESPCGAFATCQACPGVVVVELKGSVHRFWAEVLDQVARRIIGIGHDVDLATEEIVDQPAVQPMARGKSSFSAAAKAPTI